MDIGFIIHYKLRKGLGPDWIDKTAEYYYDDLPESTTYEEAKDMAISDFVSNRFNKGTNEREYLITDIVKL